MAKSVSKQDPVYRIADKLVNKQLNAIAEDPLSSVIMSDEQVHDLRVCTKKLRALLQVYRRYCRKSDIKSVGKNINKFANSYSSLRDAHVQYKTLSSTVRAFNLEHDEGIQQLLTNYRDIQQNGQEHASPANAKTGFDSILLVWDEKLEPRIQPDFQSGIEFAYGKSRKLSAKASSKNEDNAYHRCRKWAKYYLYLLKMLVKHKSGKDKSYIRKLSNLGDELGNFQDLCVLEKNISRSLDAGRQQQTNLKKAGLKVLKCLAKEKQQQKNRCNRLFKDLFKHSRSPVKR